ncbi:GNAT family N-acetyltransferase [bacterium]|nr:GNAT family N-acetyltransferase [bacterium]
MPVPVDRLTAADVPAATRTLAAAFADYPLLRAVAPHNPLSAEAFCGMLVRYCVTAGAADATADRAAVACWLPPGCGALSPLGLARSGALALAAELGLSGTVLLLRLAHQFERLERRHVPGPHWYLVLLGVEPASQRRGLARAVLRPGFDAADRAGQPCYLETQDGADVPIYQRLGFELVGHRRVAGGLWNWEMRRDPRDRV